MPLTDEAAELWSYAQVCLNLRNYCLQEQGVPYTSKHVPFMKNSSFYEKVQINNICDQNTKAHRTFHSGLVNYAL